MESRSTAAAHVRALDDWAQCPSCAGRSSCCGATLTELFCNSTELTEFPSFGGSSFSAGMPATCRGRFCGGLPTALDVEATPCSGGTAASTLGSGTCPSFPIAWATSSPTLSVASSGPNPGMAVGSVKSHWFSAMPMKSRIAGSVVQTRRSAALVNSAGTPDCRNARMSLSAVMDSIGGRLAGSKGTLGGSPAAAGAPSAP